MNVVERAQHLLEEARSTNERRLIVLSGDDQSTTSACRSILTELPVGITETICCSSRTSFACPQIPPEQSKRLMGTTRSIVIVDIHETTEPNVLGRATGAVDGGGLLILLSPPFEAVTQQANTFDAGLVVEPWSIDAVGHAFKRRLRDTLIQHEGIEWIDVTEGRSIVSGKTDPREATSPRHSPTIPEQRTFAASAYEHCRTRDQIRVLSRLERLRSPGTNVIISSERGRGKSSVGGIAAVELAMEGFRIGVTSPREENVVAFFSRVDERLHGDKADSLRWNNDTPYPVSGGHIQYCSPTDAVEAITHDTIDCLFVDEAAGLPVPILEDFLQLERVAFLTTLHGYEGAGQGFATRFRESLATHSSSTHEVTLTEPIRYAESDPLERWITHALLLDARPAVDELTDDATMEAISIAEIPPEQLEGDENRLREVMGLLSLAHYRTEPNDLARILDAPNLTLIGAMYDDCLVGITLVAEEGGLSGERMGRIDAGERLHGNMIPDILYTHFRDPTLGTKRGYRIVRIAIHQTLRRQGIASAMLAFLRNHYPTADWIGTGFGARPDVIKFWKANGFVPLIVSTKRNATSGNYSTVLLDASVTDTQLLSRCADSFPDRMRETLTDVHREIDPETIESLLAASSVPYERSVSRPAWEVLSAAAAGLGRYDIDPRGSKTLVLTYVTGEHDDDRLSDQATWLLIAKILQGRSWGTVSDQFGFDSIRTCRMALGEALASLVMTYDAETVTETKD